MSQWDEGHTIAGWTGCGIATVGVAGIAVGVCTGNALGVWGGLAVVAIGAAVTWALHLSGWGKPPGRLPPRSGGCGSRTSPRGRGIPGASDAGWRGGGGLRSFQCGWLGSRVRASR